VREEGTAPMLPPQPGKPIRTTIDLDLQTYIDSMWPAEYRGAMVAMTPDGQVLALYSAPTYDPNEFTGGIPVSIWRQLNTDSAKPLLNRATFARYPPASTFKLATAAMALKRGIIDLDTHMPIPCTGGMRAGNRYWRCWKRGGHGDVDLIGAMAGSCNVYFYQVGLRLGIKAIVEDGEALGFADKTGIDLPTELRPLYPETVAYFDSLYGKRGWTGLGMSMNYSIGQGANTQTLIKMVQFYQAIAGDGSEYVPYIVDRPTEPPHSLGITPKQIQGLRKALISVVERGTAAGQTRAATGTGAVLAIAGKTGTAQNPHGKDHGWFIGFAPADDPQIVVGGIMEFAEHGTTVVPYAVRVMRRFIFGPAAPSVDSARVQLLVESDSAPPAPLELDPDSARAAARRLADSAARRALQPQVPATPPESVPARP
jgi:penicillin-binding protein 2